MSDRQSKNNLEEAKKAYFSRVSERTRSKTDAYVELNAEACGIACDRVREQKQKRQTTPSLSVGGRRKQSGNNIVMNEPEIERVYCESSMSKRMRYASMIGSSWKNDDVSSKKPSATVQVPAAYARKRNLGSGIELIDKAEFISRKSFSPKTGSKDKMNESSSSATFKKDWSSASKRVHSDDYCESFSRREVGCSSDHAQRGQSITIIEIESDSDSEETVSEDIEIPRVDEAEIRNRKTNAKSRSSAQKVNRDEDRNDQQSEIERIDEAEFKKLVEMRRRMSSCEKNNENRQTRPASSSALKKKVGPWKKTVLVDEDDDDDDVVDSSSEESLRSSSSTESDEDDASISLQDSSTGPDSSSTDSGSDSLDADFEMDSSDEIELDRDFQCDSGAEEGSKVPTGTVEATPLRASPDMASEEKMPDEAKKAAPPSHSNDGHDHSGDREKGSNEVTSSDSHARASSNMAREKMIPAEAKEAAPLSHSNDGHDHSGDREKGSNEVTNSGSHAHASSNMAGEKKMPAEAKEVSPPSHSNDGHDHSDVGTKGETEAAPASSSHLRAKIKPARVVNVTKVPTVRKEAAAPSRSKCVREHTDEGTEERAEAVTTSASHQRAKRKPSSVEKEPTRQEKAAALSHSEYVYDETNDGAKERDEAATTSDSHLNAKSKPSGMVDAEKEPTREEEAAAPDHSNYVYEQTDEGANGITEAAVSDSYDSETEVSNGRKEVPSKPKQRKDLCSMLADAVLGIGQIPTNKETDEEVEVEQAGPSQAQDTLPLKFRFEDEVPQVMEKTEYEKEIDGLFGDLDCDWEMKDLESYDPAEDKVETVHSPPGETQHQRCCRGKHELVLEDDEGLICIYCRHVELGPKDVMPEWAERIYRESERKRCNETENDVEFDELTMKASTSDDAVAGSSSYTTGTVWSIKPGIRESMYEHQREGFEFLWRNLAGSIELDKLNSNDDFDLGGCIISHAPGTGKTRLTMVFVETYLKMFPDCRPVIISPASTLLTWEEEFKKWNVEFPFHNLSNPDLSGKENKTALGLLGRTNRRDNDVIRLIKICSWSMGRSILGISYSLFQKLSVENTRKKKRGAVADNDGKVRKILLEKPGLVVLDEGHTPRNARSNIWNVLLKLQTEKRIILSGTPFQNNFSELFNTLRIVRPAVADELARDRMFADAVAPPRRNSSNGIHWVAAENTRSSLISEDSLEYLKDRISPFVHLHKGTILKQSLPGLRDCVIILKPPMLQKRVIDTVEGSSNFKFEHEVSVISVHPYLLLKCETTESRRIGIDMAAVEASKLNPQEGAKTRFLLELVRLSVALREKVLVFSQYIQPLELVKEQLQETMQWADGKEILHLKGKLCQKQRQILINLFNDPHSEPKIMLASTKCCSEGISLIGASRVVMLDVVWNPSVEMQAICRAYRIGQKKFVHTYHLMTSGTKEDDKYCRQAEKERLSKLVFSSSNESNQQHTSLCIEDRILEAMVAKDREGLLLKIINQPKETDLIRTFGLTS